ncbi:stereocilin [Lampris incognitus]|uniref:stereocilin n=1 Tax=Lampris incognitus TaxID=2546036 RepID=UPI0024B5DFA5|nr:stereocilin [Lampris incognitus]
MRWAAAVCVLCVCWGILCGVKQACSQIQIQRKAPNRDIRLEEDIREVINQIHSLSKESGKTHASEKGSVNTKHWEDPTPRPPFFSTLGEDDLSQYFGVLSNLYAVYRPLMGERFIEKLPKTFVCILSGREDCGLVAELTKTVSLELGKPLLTLLTSLRSGTCTSGDALGEDAGSSFLRSYLRMEEATVAELNAFQDLFVTMLAHLPLSGDLLSSLSGLVDLTATYFSKLALTLLQTPIDYVKIGLQLGIKIPSIDENEHCQQGDLKQLLMWGMNHNVSWSFGNPILDIFLAPEQSLCSYPGPECQSPHSILFTRIAKGADDDKDFLLRCNHHNLAFLNDTLCADILATNPQHGSSASVIALCQELSTLSPAQLEQVWSNACFVIEALVSSFLSGSSDCGVGSTRPFTPVFLHSETTPFAPPVPPILPREARATLSLSQLLCNYGNWSEVSVVDAGLVTLCSDNDREEFVRKVCNNGVLMKKLLLDPKNNWLWGYCANSSADVGYMVSHFCHYESWMAQLAIPVDSSLVAFCWSLDGDRLKKLVCESVGLFTMLFSNPDNAGLIPNCTEIPPPPEDNLNTLVAQSCRYSQWHNPMLITIDVMSLCIRLDSQGFVTNVCSNATFLRELLLNKANSWLEEHCALSLSLPPTDPPLFFSITDWCDYSRWEGQAVDPSVVGLCWQHDQLAFQKNVCCNVPLFEKLTLEPQNEWLMAVCTDKEIIEVLPQVCKYSEWTRPIIVDMTELALCAQLDPFNFTSKVCLNASVIQNLLANLDNTWLVQHCANYSHPGVTTGGGGGQGGGLVGFKPTEQCQYSSWGIALPDAALMALCWDYDQANFVSSICPDASLLSFLARESSSMWVSTLCTTYTNYSTNNNHNKNNSSTGESKPCLARDLVMRFNWTCSADFTAVCRQGTSQTEALQVMLRCWVEALRPRVEALLSQRMATVLEQAASITVVIMVALEESQMTSLRVTENIRLSVLESVVLYLENEINFDNKRVLLQCFGKVLTSLMQTGRDVTSDGFFLIKEYFRIPLRSLRPVFSAVDNTTVRQILQYYSRNQDMLQLTDEYLSTMVSVLFQVHLLKDASLFPELAPLLAVARPADIRGLPPLQTNDNVRETINSNLLLMSEEQRWAFGQWYGRAVGPHRITSGSLSLIGDTGNLIVYLPFHSFQHLSPAQLLQGLDVLQRNPLSSLQQQFVANSLIGSYSNLTAQHFTRLGNLSCLAEPEKLLLYKDSEAFSVIQDNILTCIRQGLSLPSHMISSLFLSSTEFKSPPSLPATRLAELAHFLPWLGADFLQNLSQSQLLPALPALASVSFSPTQAAIILDKISTSYTLSAPGGLRALGTLIAGVNVETLWTLTADTLLSSLPDMAQHTPGLSPPQANSIATKLWGSPDVVDWLNKVEPLLRSTPLLSVLTRTRPLLTNSTSTFTRAWNTQQAMAIFKEVIKSKPSFTKGDLLKLGTVGQGVSCEVLRRLLQTQPVSSSVKDILAFLREQPGPLHTSLKKCVIEVLYQFEFFSELLGELGAEIALALPVSTIKKFPVDMMDHLRKLIIHDPLQFLSLPRAKQELLVDKMVQRMGMYTGEFTEEEFRSLDIMATFVVDEVFVQLRRSWFVNNLEFLRGLCYSASKRDLVARILQETGTFGPVQNWNQVTLDQVDRFLFFLPKDKLQEISQDLITPGRIERLFLSQTQWETGDVGVHCMKGGDQHERQSLFDKQQFVLQFFLGFLRVGRLSPPAVIPSCEVLHTTAPSAWTTDSLLAMSSPAFSNCLELIGRDPYLTSYQRTLLLKRTKEVYGPIPSFSPSVISRMGELATQLSAEELGSLRLTELGSISAMGAVSTWSNRQLAVLFATLLNSTKLGPSQLDSSTLVAMGHIVCGAKTTEMRTFNAVEFSKAVLWLGQLRLPCSEEQLMALVGLLTHSLAFGPTSSWGSDVFIEIGALAAGLPDMSMSALVKEQIEGITPLAVSLIPPEKFAVVFDPSQISMFSYEQAVAVTAAQRSALSAVQQTALAMVLTPWEDRPVDFRGRSLGMWLSPSPLCHLLGLLMLLILLPCPAMP